MKRLLVWTALLAGGANGLLLGLARADVDTRFHAGITAQLLGLIVVIVLVSSLFAVSYLHGFGRGAKGAIQDRFSLFIAWNLLRSHRVKLSRSSRLEAAWLRLAPATPRQRAVRVVVLLLALGVAWLCEQPGVFNAIAESLSAGVVRALQLGALAVAVALLLGVVPRGSHSKREDAKSFRIAPAGGLLVLIALAKGALPYVLQLPLSQAAMTQHWLGTGALLVAGLVIVFGSGAWSRLGALWVLVTGASWAVCSFGTLGAGGYLSSIAFFELGAGTGLVALSWWALNRPLPPTLARLEMRTAVSLPSFISIVGVSIGIWALIVVLGVMHGFADDLESKILRTNAHIVIEPQDASGVLGDYTRLEQRIRGMEGVAEALVHVHGEVMVASATNIAVNVVVKGMDHRGLSGSEALRGRFIQGGARWLDRPEALLSDRFRYPRFFDFNGDEPSLEGLEELGVSAEPVTFASDAKVVPGIVIGAELARSLGVTVGDEIQLITPDGDVGPTGLRPKLRDHRVAGIFATGMYEYDQKLAYLSVDSAQRFFNMARDVNRLEVRAAPKADIEDLQSRVRAYIAAEHKDLKVSDWRERNKNLFTALALERIAMFIVLGFIVLVASLLIVSSLVMLIIERARDIAVLKSLGAGTRAIARTFLFVGGFIGAIGTLSGVSLGVTTCALVDTFGLRLPKEYYIEFLPVKMDPIEVAIIGFGAFAICLLATVYPSLAASRLQPVEGLRHG